MIVFAAFTPHSPLLIESISKDKFKELKDTVDAMETLAKNLEDAKPDVIVTISAHSHAHETAFSLNLHDEYRVDLSQFGDMSTTKFFEPDLELMTSIQRRMRSEDPKFTLESYVTLDYGAGVPLLLLTKNINVKIVPVSYAGLDAKTHLAFGRTLKDIFSQSTKRIAVIASGDLSHCLSSDAPMGFKKEGRLFDDTILEAVKNMASSKLLALDETVLKEASECAYRPLLIFFGLLERMNLRPDIVSYESPFGVGYLVTQFHFQTV